MKPLVFVCMLLLGLFGVLEFADPVQAADNACHSQCSNCARVCEKTLSYCKKQGGKHTEANHINVLKDCISTCKQSSDFMARGSSLQKEACNLCAQACTKCAESCETFKGDKTMQDCARECRKCADSCKKMAS